MAKAGSAHITGVAHKTDRVPCPNHSANGSELGQGVGLRKKRDDPTRLYVPLQPFGKAMRCSRVFTKRNLDHVVLLRMSQDEVRAMDCVIQIVVDQRRHGIRAIVNGMHGGKMATR
jgi:hypothetical protein